MIETGTRRREIDDVASELFREHGYAATSVRDIARALDIQGASLYAHVASKEDVLWSIVDRAATALRAAADARDSPSTRDADRRRRGSPPSSEAHIEVITDDLGAVERLRPRVAPPVAGSAGAAIAGRRDAYEARFRAVIERGHRRRRVRTRPTRRSPRP